MTLFVLTVSLPVLSFTLPGFLLDLVQEARADAIRRADGQAADNSLPIERDFILPYTTGPTYHVDPKRFEFHTTPNEKHATIYLSALPFDERFIEKNRALVCPYCFFGVRTSTEVIR